MIERAFYRILTAVIYLGSTAVMGWILFQGYLVFRYHLVAK
jgi:hypothetical protein